MFFVCFRYKPGVSIKSFTEVVVLGSTSKAIAAKPCQDEPAIIMYTSGSTGTPKGVILPHEALISTIKGFHFVVNPPRDDDIYLGYLPLAHILELLAEMTMIVQGIPVGYSSPNT
jgi:long-chain acyl-CoA synthetase